MSSSMISFLTNEPMPKELQEAMNNLKNDGTEMRSPEKQKTRLSFQVFWTFIIVCIVLLVAAGVYWYKTI